MGISETSTDGDIERSRTESWDREWTCSFLSVTTTLGSVPVRWYVWYAREWIPLVCSAVQCSAERPIHAGRVADGDKQIGIAMQEQKITTVK